MKKYLLTIATLLAFGVSAFALSDNEVLTKAKALYDKGMAETEIAKELVGQGATIEQLQRIKDQLAAAQEGAGETAGEVKVKRVANGQVKPAGAPDAAPTPAPAASGVFGANIFNNPNLTFEPEMNVATPANYVLGAGDEVIIDIYGASQLQIKKTITPEGMVTIQDYGPVKLAGLSIKDATRRLQNTVGSRYKNSELMLSLGQTRTIGVNILGEVALPGTYQLSSFSTVFNALYVAGGISPIGTLRNIKVYRAGKLAGAVDVYEYLLTGKTTNNIRLTDGDVIIVEPFANRVAVGGNVKRPMTYELLANENLANALAYAGGFSNDAYVSAVRVVRNNANHSVLTVKAEDFVNCPMMDGDTVEVEAMIDRLANTVSVKGAIFRPGQYGLGENVKTVGQLIAMAGGPIETAFLKRGVLYRLKEDRTMYAIPVDLAGILAGTVADIELANEDEIYVPDVQARLAEQTVTIAGQVLAPATFPYAENESVEDLILRAGGLTKEASTLKVDVVRRYIDPKASEEQNVRSEVYSIEINEAMSVADKGFILEPFDEVYVRKSPVAAEPIVATINGEAVFEGKYELPSKSTRMSDLVKSAGGLTQFAYVEGAVLVRTMNREERAKRNILENKYENETDTDTLTIKTLDLSDTYTVGIDLAKALKNPGSDFDVVLRNGDVLFVPTMVSTVKVNGAVLYPNAVNYEKGKGAYYYIKQAGGYDLKAQRSKAYILYLNGKTALASTGKIMPGCEIVVPTRTTKETTTQDRIATASIATSLTSVVSTLAILIYNVIQ